MARQPSVIIDNFDVARALVRPCEAHAPLVIDADAVLAGTVAYWVSVFA